MSRSTTLRALLGLGFVLSAGTPAFAQRVPYAGRIVTPEEAATLRSTVPVTVASVHPAYGTSSSNILAFGACDAIARSSNYPIVSENCDLVEPLNVGLGAMAFPVHLPTGSLIQNVTFYYFDTDDTYDPSVAFVQYDGSGGFGVFMPLAFPTFNGGNHTASFDIAPPLQVNDAAGSYALMAVLTKNATQKTGIYKVEVRYKLQVSPDPATATFTDVPVGHPQHRFVEALAAAGITAGCGGGNFCPDQPLTRGQMAVFLSVALGLNWPN